MAKLTLRDRIEFYREKKLWLIKGRYFYQLKRVGIDVYLDKNNAVWVATELPNGKKGIMKISKENQKTWHFKMLSHKEVGIYFLGTEGIFCKTPQGHLQTIYYEVPDFIAADVSEREMGIIHLYQKGRKVTTIQLSQKEFGKVEKVVVIE